MTARSPIASPGHALTVQRMHRQLQRQLEDVAAQALGTRATLVRAMATSSAQGTHSFLLAAQVCLAAGSLPGSLTWHIFMDGAWKALQSFHISNPVLGAAYRVQLPTACSGAGYFLAAWTSRQGSIPSHAKSCTLAA